MPTSFPGHSGTFPRHPGTLAQILRGSGYVTFCVGKWHLEVRWCIAGGHGARVAGARIPADARVLGAQGEISHGRLIVSLTADGVRIGRADLEVSKLTIWKDAGGGRTRRRQVAITGLVVADADAVDGLTDVNMVSRDEYVRIDDGRRFAERVARSLAG